MTLKTVYPPPSAFYPQLEDAYVAPLRKYQGYIQDLCLRIPSLSTLCSVLADPKPQRHGCNIVALDFRVGLPRPVQRTITGASLLAAELSHGISDDMERSNELSEHPLQGRMLIIEDLTVEVITILGTELDIDPLFLATHLHTVHRTGMRHQTPDDATLPSRLHQKSYVNISHHQPVTCEEIFPSGAKFTADAAIKRKLVFLRATAIGLAQHRTSIIKLRRDDKFWLGESHLT